MDILMYILVGIASGMFVLFMIIIGLSFWIFFVWNEYMKMDDNDLKNG
jgi:hypothetical protein